MAEIKCNGCNRSFSEDKIRWILPFDSGTPGDETIVDTPVVLTKPVPGAAAYCPDCLERYREDSK